MEPRFDLPKITFTEKSAQQIEADFLSEYKRLTGQSLSQADPRRKFIQAIIPIIAQQRVLIDFSAKQNLLAYSVGGNLDHLGVFMDTSRLQASYASTTLRFTLSAIQPNNVTILAGTRVTAGDDVFWVTVSDLVIPAGEAVGTVVAQCEIAGVAGNGYLTGEINQLVSPIPYVALVENVSVSAGGADIESDEQYAKRIHEAPESVGAAGTEGAYKYWAKTASQTIIDVSVHSPSPGVVEIRPLLVDGAIPGPEILNAVLEICNNKNTRPLTDNVQVLAPEQVSYDIDMIYHINSANASVVAGIQARVNQAVDGYRLWQRSKLGRGIDPSELIARVKNAGAKRVTVALPAYQYVDFYQVATENQVTVTYGGLEDE